MTAQDYIFADVAEINVGGEVLPKHDAGGAWRPERGEDWAFLAEAWGERNLIEYRDAQPARTAAEVEAWIARIRGQRFMRNLRVADAAAVYALLDGLEYQLREERGRWCARAPSERAWNEDGQSLDWEARCPEMYPARQLHMPETMEYRWEVAKMRAVFADLAANERYVCSNWHDMDALRLRLEYSTGGDRDVTGSFCGAYEKTNHAGTVYWARSYPVASTLALTLPEGAGTPTLATLWHATGQNAGVDKWYVKNVAPDGITPQFMETMLPQMTGSDDHVSVNLESFRLIVPITLRTRLN